MVSRRVDDHPDRQDGGVPNTVVSWRAAVAVGVVSSLISTCWTQSVDVVWFDDQWSWRRLILHVATGTVLTGGAWLLGMRLAQRSRSFQKNRPQRELLTVVRRTGRVPEGSEPPVWLPVLTRRRRDLAWISALCVGVGVAVTVPVVLAASRSGPQAPGIWALAGGLVALTIGLLQMVLRERRLVERLLTAPR
ncbi:hypothetical protein TEK04_03350 [Klenkia sp. LSe6-5]|uniref:SdpI/YhfL protein family protein n=1 Tax=Klenkia sesuvii TaxID=3103137 RepID=A0ABU8DRU5_9ACTN